MSLNPLNFASQDEVHTLLDQTVFHNFMASIEDQQGKVCADYVWIGGTM